METFPNLDADNLVIFYVVVTEKSMTAAAEKLFLTQPAITYRIKTLEEYTRVKLLDIKKHQVILTPSGQEVFKYAREIYHQLLGADRFIKSIRESNLRVGIASIYTYVASPVLNAIFEEHQPSVKLTIESGNAMNLVQNVTDARLDLAIVPRFNYNNDKLKSVEISYPMKLHCFAGRDQIIDHQPLSWKELNNYPLVSGPSTSVVRRMISERFKREGIEMKPLAAEVDNIVWCIDLVEHGKGLSFAFKSFIEPQVKEGRLKLVELTDDLFLSADAIMSHDLFMNPIINRFITMVKAAFATET
ncbi:MAG TPA: LysR family transcriptional regulator [Dehalococcoidales bacterium]|nr:LysR family transcriptional regulator [Dehalococcoidales bacterium]